MLNDITKLIMRLGVGILMLFHGAHKIIHGIAPIKQMVVSRGLPEVFAYGVYVGEVAMPILIILGVYARVAAGVMAVNMIFAIFLAYWGSLLTLTPQGGVVFELAFIYLLVSIAISVYGSGKFAINNK
ncbi:MAG: DoxX family protein [Sulfuricurvum sp.]